MRSLIIVTLGILIFFGAALSKADDNYYETLRMRYNNLQNQIQYETPTFPSKPIEFHPMPSGQVREYNPNTYESCNWVRLPSGTVIRSCD